MDQPNLQMYIFHFLLDTFFSYNIIAVFSFHQHHTLYDIVSVELWSSINYVFVSASVRSSKLCVTWALWLSLCEQRARDEPKDSL